MHRRGFIGAAMAAVAGIFTGFKAGKVDAAPAVAEKVATLWPCRLAVRMPYYYGIQKIDDYFSVKWPEDLDFERHPTLGYLDWKWLYDGMSLDAPLSQPVLEAIRQKGGFQADVMEGFADITLAQYRELWAPGGFLARLDGSVQPVDRYGHNVPLFIYNFVPGSQDERDFNQNRRIHCHLIRNYLDRARREAREWAAASERSKNITPELRQQYTDGEKAGMNRMAPSPPPEKDLRAAWDTLRETAASADNDVNGVYAEFERLFGNDYAMFRKMLNEV